MVLMAKMAKEKVRIPKGFEKKTPKYAGGVKVERKLFILKKGGVLFEKKGGKLTKAGGKSG